MQNTLSSICGHEAGFIVGETNPLEFTFVSSRELLPPRLEYLVVPGVEEKGRHASNELDSFMVVQGQHCQAESPLFDACRRNQTPSDEAASIHVDILAQVVEIGIGSAILSDRLTYDETMAILRGEYAPQP